MDDFIQIEKLTLKSKVEHVFYGTGQIISIDNSKVKVSFNCPFLKNTFQLCFVNDSNDYYKDNNRHIYELRLKIEKLS